MNLLTQARALWRNITHSGVIAPEEIEAELHLPVVAIIPHLERRKIDPTQSRLRKRQIDLEGRWRSRLLLHFSQESSASLAYESVVKDVAERSRTKRQKVWLLAGSVAGEGTSLTCMNLAIVAQRRGVRTLIIEAHTRSPRISRVLGLDLEPGLTGCLQRALNVSSAVRLSDLAKVHVLPAGPIVAYPETLWGSPAFHRLLAEVRSHYDLIFLEGPPVLLYP